jgi:hypothetical protein
MSDTQHSLQTYISDMLALEQHVRIPFDAQLADGDLSNYTTAQALLRRLSDTSNAQHGGHEASPVKDAVSATAGFFASAIDKMRKTKIAKALRDDYTAISLCSVSYGMLLSTANAFGKPDVVQLAQRHMRDYAQILMEISDAMPEIVIADLQDTGLSASPAAVEESRSQIEQVWRSSAAAEKSGATTGEIARGTATGQTIRSV